MAGSLAASFAALQNQPTIAAAFTAWTRVQGATGEMQRLSACNYKADHPLAFGCIIHVNATPPRVVVRAGAVAEIPTETVSQMLVTSAAALLMTDTSRALNVLGDVIIEDGAVLGCLGCVA